MALIELRNLCKTFKGKTQTVDALKDITLDINKGDIYGIIGMSGAGKSTLVRCINFLERPTGGSVIIDGKDLSQLDAVEMRELRQQVSMIFQHFNLLQQRNVRGNVSFAMEIAGIDDETRKNYIREMLTAYGLNGEVPENALAINKPESLGAYCAVPEGTKANAWLKTKTAVKGFFVFVGKNIAFAVKKYISPVIVRALSKLGMRITGIYKTDVSERTDSIIAIAVPEKQPRAKKHREQLSAKERARLILNETCAWVVKAAKATAAWCVRAAKAVRNWFVSLKGLNGKRIEAGFKKTGSAIAHAAVCAWKGICTGTKKFIAWLKPAVARTSVSAALSASGIVKMHRNERISELLDIVGLTERQYNYPSQLSGGQQQRVAIARALATDPQIILCDEATSALDPTTTTQILNLLREINQKLGITIVIITHEMKVVESICSHVAIIDNGVLAEHGSVEQIFKHPETDVAKRLIFRKDGASAPALGERMVRVVFDGSESTEPVIANLILECGIVVNIMHADTRDVGGKAFGQMVLQLPEEKLQQEKAIYYLQTHGLTVENIDAIPGAEQEA